MKSIKKVLRIFIKRPFILLIAGLFALAFCIVDLYNPIFDVVILFNGKESILDSYISLLRLGISFFSNLQTLLTFIITNKN